MPPICLKRHMARFTRRMRADLAFTEERGLFVDVVIHRSQPNEARHEYQ